MDGKGKIEDGYIPYKDPLVCPKISGFPLINLILFGRDVSTINPIRSGRCERILRD